MNSCFSPTDIQDEKEILENEIVARESMAEQLTETTLQLTEMKM